MVDFDDMLIAFSRSGVINYGKTQLLDTVTTLKFYAYV